ncbi:MAG: Tox-REase-5 domain-containing protein [Stenotrophomonas sp.]
MPFIPMNLPLPPPPIIVPGGWDPAGEMPDDSPRGPSAGQLWQKLKDAIGVGADSKVEPQAQTRDTDCSQTSNKNQCNACKLGQGFIIPANYTIPHKQYRDFDYQIRIANLHAGPEKFFYTNGGPPLDRGRLKVLGGKNEVTVSEWMHGLIRFDGFWRDMCTAVETKAHYKQFFDEAGELHPWALIRKGQRNILENWVVQATAHVAHIGRLGPPAKIEWHFLEAASYRAAILSFGPMAGICRFTP